MNPNILTPEVQHYLREREAAAPTEIALQKSPFPDVSAFELAQQLDSRQRCRKKLPRWYETPGIYYPEKRSVEQASSQVTADYKASLISPGTRVADLTGGMGVDSLFFAGRAEGVVHCETNGKLSQIARHNAFQLGVHNIDFRVTDGLAYLQSQAVDTFDCIYLDPSRRVGHRKVFRLEDCEPDVVEVQNWLLEKAKKNLIKCAPLLDISAALERLHGVSEIHIVSVDNECKELLFIRIRGYQDTPRMVVAALGGKTAKLAFDADAEKTAVARFGDPEEYLYEPDAAFLKAGAFKFISQHYGIHKLHTHTHLYTSTQRIPDFIGKTYRVRNVVQYADFKKSKDPVYATISTRNFPVNVNALHQRHKIHDSGDMHLFFCTGGKDRLLVIFASKC
ncbi:hypothetical protein [Parapedobacter defluvii]|uniref:THUMP-like domain-containing protein n=1 Tax=Parapedobacter defluvii TaxID=2045106 RepID=UPI003341859A